MDMPPCQRPLVRLNIRLNGLIWEWTLRRRSKPERETRKVFIALAALPHAGSLIPFRLSSHNASPLEWGTTSIRGDDR